MDAERRTAPALYIGAALCIMIGYIPHSGGWNRAGVMALRIRLMRVGKRHHPSYRVVVKEARSPRQGKYLEWVGTYSPRSDPEAAELNEDRIAYWLSVGARPSETVARLLRKYTSLSVPDDGRAKVHSMQSAEEQAAQTQAPDEVTSAEAVTPETTQDSPNEEEAQ